MRRVLSLALLAIVLAGCTSGTSDDLDTPPNADPNGGAQTLPPASTTTPSTGAPTLSNSSSASATSTSASATQAPAPQPVSFSSHDEEDASSHDSFPSLLVAGRLQGSGPQVRIEATANNMGERAYRVKDGCERPWSESMLGPGGQAVQHRQPAATCAGYTMKEFPAHDFLSTGLTWDGKLWDAGQNAFVRAPAGTYVWQVVFDVYSGGTGTQFEDHAALTLTFDVIVP